MVNNQTETMPKITVLFKANLELLVSDIRKTKRITPLGFYPDWVSTHLGRLDESINCIHDMMKKAVFHSIKSIEKTKSDVFYVRYNESSSNRNISFDFFFGDESSHLFNDFARVLLESTRLFERWVDIEIRKNEIN